MTAHILERRNTKGHVEFRAGSEDRGPMLAGHAAVFNRSSLDLGGFREVIDPGAFAKTVREADVVALWNHNYDNLLGRVRSGTLRLSIDDRGLMYEVDLPDTTSGRDVAELGRRGDLGGSSFAFRTIRDEWSEDESGNVTRRLLEVALDDVSPVTRPAYPDADDAAVRSLAHAISVRTDRPADPDEVRHMIEARTLGRLLLPAQPEQVEDEPQVEERSEDVEDGRAEPTVFRPPLTHLFV